MQAAQQLDTLQQSMEWHENLISNALQLDKVKDRLFSDFEGSIKSLGAWGGDFVMAVSPLTTAEVMAYFEAKGYHTLLTWDELVLDGK
jgi:hypothetical protein